MKRFLWVRRKYFAAGFLFAAGLFFASSSIFATVGVAFGAEFLAAPDFLDWSDRSDKNLAHIAQILNDANFTSRFSLKREYRLEPWREKLAEALRSRAVPKAEISAVQKDVNRTLLDDWELEFASKFAACYQRDEPLGCALTTFHAGVPVAYYLDCGRLASEIQASPNVPHWIPDSVRNIYGLPGANYDVQKHQPAVAVLAEYLDEETVKFLESLEKQGFHVDLVSRRMLERATKTLEETPTGVQTILGIGAMEYIELRIAPDTESLP